MDELPWSDCVHYDFWGKPNLLEKTNAHWVFLFRYIAANLSKFWETLVIFKIAGHWRRQSRWVSSTARRGLQVPRLSGWSFSVGSSTPSDPPDCARRWTLSAHERTEVRERHRWVFFFFFAADNFNRVNSQKPDFFFFLYLFAFNMRRVMKLRHAIAPVCLEGKVRNLRRCVPRRCGRSLRGGRGRWSASARRCSLDSTQSCSGCSPAPGWPRIGGQRSWPWWTRGSCSECRVSMCQNVFYVQQENNRDGEKNWIASHLS